MKCLMKSLTEDKLLVKKEDKLTESDTRKENTAPNHIVEKEKSETFILKEKTQESKLNFIPYPVREMSNCYQSVLTNCDLYGCFNHKNIKEGFLIWKFQSFFILFSLFLAQKICEFVGNKVKRRNLKRR